MTVVEAQDEEDAVRVATEMGRNPGGEIMIIEVPKAAMDEPDVQVLLTKLVGEEEALAMGGKKRADGPEVREWAKKVVLWPRVNLAMCMSTTPYATKEEAEKAIADVPKGRRSN